MSSINKKKPCLVCALVFIIIFFVLIGWLCFLIPWVGIPIMAYLLIGWVVNLIAGKVVVP